MKQRFDLGEGRILTLYEWNPPAPTNLQPSGCLFAVVLHRSGSCSVTVHLDSGNIKDLWPNGNYWSVTNLKPMTIEPAIVCSSCGEKGAVTDGKWVPC